ncbi:hypothetical protein BBJ28_00016928 [Nothophytophthora sp. Chile5]|nr:hypothetical protein BBJ28_00016928 [Nothophytophthora sp. Chile5]
MRRLNAALLDSVDRLQLGNSAELAPQAKLVVSFTQREHLKQQMHQSKTMLALIERLTQIDTLLGELDAAIDQQRFVAAAEGLATAESLLVELTDANGSSHNEDKSIVRLIRLQLLDKKSRLLSQLSRFFSCSVLWQDGAVKVAKEGGSESLEKRREFWKACEVLDILTLRLKEVAKATTQYLVKPLLQLPHGVVKLVREDSGVKLTLVRQHEQPETATTASEVAQVQDKCANVVNVLLFVHSELFAGNSELMHRLGDLMWKIPGNLEAQLMNLLQDKIPQDATSLNSYRSVLVTAVRLITANCGSSLHSKKRRQGILSQGRELMRQGYHDSVKLPVATEKSGLNAPISAEKKGASGKDEDPVFDSEDVASGCFQTPDYRVTVCAHDLVELTHQTLIEGCTSGVASAKLLFQTSRDLLFLFRTIVPTLHEDDIANDPRTCMLYHNDCIYIAHHMLVIGHLYKQRYVSFLQEFGSLLRTYHLLVCVYVCTP